ncbi:hypothetical protein E3Q03_00325 [Wallemia mellicola]|uniref:HMG box domain-containing protein n=1 Tax=Wallemia mellicola TaxID=1708541 RepID=A0AB74KI73_9BASI|nr:hypothetical protein E3Q03_00325 [Wallemia mellicola]
MDLHQAPMEEYIQKQPSTDWQPFQKNEDSPPKRRRKRLNENPKPQNAWLIYRNEYQDNLKASGGDISDMKVVSAMASAAYAKLTEEERSRYLTLAKIGSEEFKLKHPGIKFKRRTKSKESKHDANTNTSVNCQQFRNDALEADGLSSIETVFSSMLSNESIDKELDGGQQDVLPDVLMYESCRIDPTKLRPRFFPRSFGPPDTDYSMNPFSCFGNEPSPYFESSYSLLSSSDFKSLSDKPLI